jgi:cob(I)alamin adenosyltransferase
MKIYTRTGDSGETSLFGGDRVSKNHLRVATYGTVDEFNSTIGLAVAFCTDPNIKNWLETVQKDLFALGSWLASREASQNIIDGKDPFTGERKERTTLTDSHILQMESQIDLWEKELTPMRAFILPGGGNFGAFLHLARAIGRRAEREVVGLRDSGEPVPEYVIRYLNRLADALFVLARFANHRDGKPETIWN